jgi:DNA-binding response OmpR family regulator
MYNILLLEDDLVLGDTIYDLFELNNFKITWVKDGKMALDEIYDNSFDLLLLDINVSYINGFEILTQIRQNDIDTPVVFITAKVDIGSFKKGFNLGAIDYIKNLLISKSF